MKSHPIPETYEKNDPGGFLMQARELNKVYKLEIFTQPTTINSSQGYCFTTYKIKGHVTQQSLTAWDLDKNQYWGVNYSTSPDKKHFLIASMPAVTLTEQMQLKNTAHDSSLGKSKLELNLCFKEDDKVEVSDIHLTKNEKEESIPNYSDSIMDFLAKLDEKFE